MIIVSTLFQMPNQCNVGSTLMSCPHLHIQILDEGYYLRADILLALAFLQHKVELI